MSLRAFTLRGTILRQRQFLINCFYSGVFTRRTEEKSRNNRRMETAPSLLLIINIPRLFFSQREGQGFYFCFYFFCVHLKGRGIKQPLRQLAELPSCSNVFPGLLGCGANPGAELAPWAHLGSPGGFQTQSSAFGRRKFFPSW